MALRASPGLYVAWLAMDALSERRTTDDKRRPYSHRSA
jgi:hypothetical protein